MNAEDDTDGKGAREGATPAEAGGGRGEEEVSVLRARGVTRVYRMGEVDVHALRGVDFDLHAGEFLVLLGASGSGKSTLLNILGGLDRPTEGTVHFRPLARDGRRREPDGRAPEPGGRAHASTGRAHASTGGAHAFTGRAHASTGRASASDGTREVELTHAEDRELTEYRRHHVGFIFQFYNLMPSLTARENVALVTEISRDPMSPEEALELVGLADRMDHFPAQLSGGEQQRVAVARAVAKRPGLLLCDEPTGALDYRSGVRVLEVIERVNEELGTATAVITHNAPIAEMAHRVVNLHDGEVEREYRPERRTRAAGIRW